MWASVEVCLCVCLLLSNTETVAQSTNSHVTTQIGESINPTSATSLLNWFDSFSTSVSITGYDTSSDNELDWGPTSSSELSVDWFTSDSSQKQSFELITSYISLQDMPTTTYIADVSNTYSLTSSYGDTGVLNTFSSNHDTNSLKTFSTSYETDISSQLYSSYDSIEPIITVYPIAINTPSSEPTATITSTFPLSVPCSPLSTDIVTVTTTYIWTRWYNVYTSTLTTCTKRLTYYPTITKSIAYVIGYNTTISASTDVSTSPTPTETMETTSSASFMTSASYPTMTTTVSTSASSFYEDTAMYEQVDDTDDHLVIIIAAGASIGGAAFGAAVSVAIVVITKALLAKSVSVPSSAASTNSQSTSLCGQYPAQRSLSDVEISVSPSGFPVRTKGLPYV